MAESVGHIYTISTTKILAGKPLKQKFYLEEPGEFEHKGKAAWTEAILAGGHEMPKGLIPFASVKVRGGAVRRPAPQPKPDLAAAEQVQPSACDCEHTVLCRTITALKLAGGSMARNDLKAAVWPGEAKTDHNLYQNVDRLKKQGWDIVIKQGTVTLRGWHKK